ncbi:3'-5' exonuclease [Actinomadura sp. HBU206391]|uniref:3'-5' exonuclease n=1 Tax=Actinomadura sp. HBU206391 TaxID=2731692 RepID=UPI00164EE9B4|nr:3'-5' exonuclease [Actinomadura sp. HBU206391]
MATSGRADGGRALVAHNAIFDSAMLTTEFARTGAAPDDPLVLCALDLARRFSPGQRSLTLDHCAAAEGISLAQAHTASHDAQPAAQILLRALPRRWSCG